MLQISTSLKGILLWQTSAFPLPWSSCFATRWLLVKLPETSSGLIRSFPLSISFYHDLFYSFVTRDMTYQILRIHNHSLIIHAIWSITAKASLNKILINRPTKCRISVTQSRPVNLNNKCAVGTRQCCNRITFFACPMVSLLIRVNMFMIGSWYNTDIIKHCEVLNICVCRVESVFVNKNRLCHTQWGGNGL
jgi:hypothetical protein